MLQAIPLTSLLLVLGALTLVGTPPLNIYMSKFGIIGAGFAGGYLWLMVLILLALAIIFAALLKLLSSSVFGEVPGGMTRGETRTWALGPLAVLAVLVLVLGVYLPPQLETLRNQATAIALAGQGPAGSAEGVMNLARILIP